MGGTSPMCFSPIKIGQKEEETKKVFCIHYIESGRTFGWSIRGKNSADVVKADEFRLNFLRGLKKKIYMKPRLNLS